MKLTDIELEIMNVLWKSELPLTASDIIAASPKRTWKETSIHVILKTLQAKSVVVVDHHVPTTGRSAKAYKVAVEKAQYLASQVLEFGVDLPELFKALVEEEKKLKKSPKIVQIHCEEND